MWKKNQYDVMNCRLAQNEKFIQRFDLTQVDCGSHCFKSNISQSFPDFKLVVCAWVEVKKKDSKAKIRSSVHESLETTLQPKTWFC